MAFLVISYAFLRVRKGVLGVVGELVFFLIFAYVVLGIKLKLFTGF